MPAKNRKRKVLVLGDDDRAFLTVIRSLGRQGIEVHVGWCPANAIALRSRFVANVHKIPCYHPGKDDWKSVLMSLMRREDYDLVIPCHDPMIIPLQTNAEEFNECGMIYLLNPVAYSVVNNKAETSRLARSVKIPTPRENRVSKIDQIYEITSKYDFPLILKPISSFSEVNTEVKRYVRRVYNLEEFRSQLSEMLPQGEILVQENFTGKGAGVEVLANHGKILAAFQHLRIHEPLSGGGSSYRKSASLDPNLLDATKRLLRALDYTGVAMVEYKVNTKTGEWILVEINGRFWGSLPLAVSAGVDFPYYLYEMLVCGKNRFDVRYTENVYCRNITRDLVWLRDNLKADHSDPNLDTRPWSEVAKEIKHILRFREHIDTLTFDDPSPGLNEIRRLAAKALRKSVNIIQDKTIESELVTRYTRKLLLQKLESSNRIAFVCKGNICRSPFSEYYARKIFPRAVEVLSFGYYPKDGRAPPENAIRAASDFGVDIRLHRSKVLHKKNVCEADVIFTFDAENRRTLMAAYPWAKHKLFPLGLLGENETLMIADPYGKSVYDFKASYRFIGRAVEEMNRELRIYRKGTSLRSSK